jgi:hypothetical protein
MNAPAHKSTTKGYPVVNRRADQGSVFNGCLRKPWSGGLRSRRKCAHNVRDNLRDETGARLARARASPGRAGGQQGA